MDKILISACFLGANVRYNAIKKPLPHALVGLWRQQGRLISVCPEVAGGLPVPRPAAEIQHIDGQLQVVTKQQQNVSQAFSLGAEQALALCQSHNIRFALLKESSPSCGSETIYDGTFSGIKIAGQGVTTRLLEQNGIKVFSERGIEQLAQLLK